MRHVAKVFGLAAIAATAAAAQADGPGMMRPGMGPAPGGALPPPPPGPAPALLLVVAADADRSRDVTADEWAALIAAVDSDGDDIVDLDALASALPAPPQAPPPGADVAAALTHLFDQDGDGTVTVTDLDAFFARLDADGDGALSQEELAPPEHDGGGDMGGDHHGPGPGPGPAPRPDAGDAGWALFRAADADDSHDVTADEWSAFLDSLGADENGAVDLDALADAIHAPAVPEGEDASRRNDFLARAFDRDGDGVVTLDDLNAFFAALDADGDGALSGDELRPPRPMHGDEVHGAIALLHAADADDSRDVTADEWSAFLAGLTVDQNGAISLDSLASAIGAPEPEDGDTTRRDAMLVRLFDHDGDGTVEIDDLQWIFDEIDRTDDGAIDRDDARGAPKAMRKALRRHHRRHR